MLAMMVAALGFTACSSSSDDDGGGNTSKLVGTWDVVSNKFVLPCVTLSS